MSEEIKIEYRPLAELARWKRNPKGHDIPALQASMRRFGFVNPLVEDGTAQRIVAGHGRLEALLDMQQKGEEPPARIKVNGKGEWLAPIVTGVSFASEQEAEGFLMADNRLSEIGGWDNRALAEMLRDGGDLLDGTGFTTADLSIYLPLLIEGPPLPDAVQTGKAADPNDPAAHWGGMPEFANQNLSGVKDLILHFKTWEDYDAFAELIGQKLSRKSKSTWYPAVEPESASGQVYKDEP